MIDLKHRLAQTRHSLRRRETEFLEAQQEAARFPRSTVVQTRLKRKRESVSYLRTRESRLVRELRDFARA